MTYGLAAEPGGHRDTSAILSFLAAERGIDLSDHRPEVVEARLAARLAATRSPDRAAYLRRLAHEPKEIDRLVDCLLINVTSFFRDEAVFERLRAELPAAFAGRAPGDAVRAWVVGASTGEEAWSVAMLLAEACPPSGAFEVLASDLDPAALEVARSGRYAREAALAVPERLRARFLTPEGGAVRMVPELRERVRFARHDLMGRRLAPPEAVVASFDLVLCRNVLIYFTRRLQEKAFERLAELLRPGNLLVMGLAEWLPGRLAESFAPLDARLKIYRRRERRP